MLFHSVVNNACDMKIYVTWIFCHCEITSNEEQEIKTTELDKYCASMMMITTQQQQQQKLNSEFLAIQNPEPLTVPIFTILGQCGIHTSRYLINCKASNSVVLNQVS